MTSRRARRSSILKTRYDGGSAEEINVDNGEGVGGGGGTRNLTGLNRRRVSFSHTNQVKEYEKPNSSTEDSLTTSLSNKTTDFSQTMCGMNMTSVYMDDEENHHQTRDDANKTRVGNEDISVYQTTSYINHSVTESDRGIDNSNNYSMMVGMSKATCDYSMSVYVEDDMTYEGNQTREDTDKTRVGTADISVYQTLRSPTASKPRIDHFPTDREMQMETFNSSVKEAMSKTTCDYNMSVYAEDGDDSMDFTIASNQTSNDAGKTLVGVADMSVYQTLHPTVSKSTTANSFIDREINECNSTLKEVMSKTSRNYSMGIYVEDDDDEMIDEDIQARDDVNKTRVGISDISVYQTLPNTAKSSTVLSVTNNREIDTFNPSRKVVMSNRYPYVENEENGNHERRGDGSKDQLETRQISVHDEIKSVVGTRLYFRPTDPEQFRNPFGQGKSLASKRRARDTQQEQGSKLSFGKFGCAKTPKRNKISTSIVPEKGIIKQSNLKSSSTPDVDSQTSSLMIKAQQYNNANSYIPGVMAKSVRLVEVETFPIVQDQQVGRGSKAFSKVEVQTAPLVRNAITPKAKEISMQEVKEMEARSRLPVPAHTTVIDKSVLNNDSGRKVVCQTPPPPVAQGASKTVKNVNPNLKTTTMRKNILQTPPIELTQSDTAGVFKTFPREESFFEINSADTVNPPPPEKSREQGAVAFGSLLNPESFTQKIPTNIRDGTVPTFQSEAVSLKSIESVHDTRPLQSIQVGESIVQSESVISQIPPSVEKGDQQFIQGTEIINPSILTTVESIPMTFSLTQAPQAVVVDEINEKTKSMDIKVISDSDSSPQSIQTPSDAEMKDLSTPNEVPEDKMPVIISKASRKRQVEPKAPGTHVTAVNVVVPKSTTVKHSSQSEECVIAPQNSSITETSSPDADVSGSFARRGRGKLSRVQISHAVVEAEPDDLNSSSSIFLDIKRKLNVYANDSSLDIFEKWGFLDKVHDKLARIMENEWAEILKTDKIRDFLGDEFVKAVNIERLRLNDPHPLYQEAVKTINRDKMKSKIY